MRDEELKKLFLTHIRKAFNEPSTADNFNNDAGVYNGCNVRLCEQRFVDQTGHRFAKRLHEYAGDRRFADVRDSVSQRPARNRPDSSTCTREPTKYKRYVAVLRNACSESLPD